MRSTKVILLSVRNDVHETGRSLRNQVPTPGLVSGAGLIPRLQLAVSAIANDIARYKVARAFFPACGDHVSSAPDFNP